jgi:hypothetical protein
VRFSREWNEKPVVGAFNQGQKGLEARSIKLLD